MLVYSGFIWVTTVCQSEWKIRGWTASKFLQDVSVFVLANEWVTDQPAWRRLLYKCCVTFSFLQYIPVQTSNIYLFISPWYPSAAAYVYCVEYRSIILIVSAVWGQVNVKTINTAVAVISLSPKSICYSMQAHSFTDDHSSSVSSMFTGCFRWIPPSSPNPISPKPMFVESDLRCLI